MKRHFPFFMVFLFAVLAVGTAHAQTEVTGGSLNIHSHSADSANTVLPNSGSAAIGKNNTVPVNFSCAFGDRNTVGPYAVCSFTAGGLNTVTSSNALCLGGFNTVSSAFGLALGRYLRATGLDRSFVIGTGLALDAPLECAVSNQLAVGFQSTKPTLTVTGSNNNYSQGVIDKTGKVAIGDVVPQAKLHIRSDAGENAGIIIEPKQPNSASTFIRLRDSYHQLSVSNSGTMQLSAGANTLNLTGGNFSVSGSRLDVGTNQQPRFVMIAQGVPALYSNAYPSHNTLCRFTEAPSYAFVFGNDALTVRTAEYQPPRDPEITNWRDALALGIDGSVTLYGKVGVNTTNDTRDYALAVDGGIITTKVHIQDIDEWPDYVFSGEYPLMTAEQLRSYIGKHGHLPGIPSAAEVEEQGFDMASMQAALLRQIEELTLHTLRQQELIDDLLARSERQHRLIALLAAGDTVRFAYDACGNRVSRTLEFSRDTEDKNGPDDTSRKWLAALDDRFTGCDMALFPNPTEGHFTLSLSGKIPAGTTAMLLAPTGTVLSEHVLHNDTEEFDLSAQPAGIYLLRLSNGNETRTFKIIKRN